MSNSNDQIPNTLYHYTTKEVLIEHILPDNQLKIGSFRYTNDPKEKKKFTPLMSIFSTPPTDIHARTKFTDKIQEMFQQVRFDEWQVLCLTMNIDLHSGITDEYEKDVSKHFSKGYSLARMWAQYASNHTGVCLELNGQALLNNIKKVVMDENNIIHAPVVYSNGLKENLYAYNLDYEDKDIEQLSDEELVEIIRGHVKKFHGEFYLSKYRDWSNEYEFRFLVHKEKADEIYIEIFSALDNVILGEGFKSAYEPSIKNFCEANNIAVSKIDWSRRYPFCDKGSIYMPT